MTGIAGLYDHKRQNGDLACIVTAMMQAAKCQTFGQWAEQRTGIVLSGPRRDEASISYAQSADHRWVAVMDGALYNVSEVQSRLNLASAVTAPLQVLLDAVGRWGVLVTLQRLDGRFSLALWDRSEQILYLARDRFGERTLYWAQDGENIAFSSALRGLRPVPWFCRQLDEEALESYMRLGWFPAPLTPFRSVRAVLPGHVLSFKRGDVVSRSYWHGAERAVERVSQYGGGEAAAAERLNQLLRASVAVRLNPAHTHGVFLSGGVADLTLAGIVRNLVGGSLSSFALNFAAQPSPSAHMARTVADYLGSRHQDVSLSDGECAASLQRMVMEMDPPDGSVERIRGHLLAEAAGSQCQSVVDAAGARELFGGHGRYQRLSSMWQRHCALPKPVQRFRSLFFQLMTGWSGEAAQAARLQVSSLLEMQVMEHGRWLECSSPLRTPHTLQVPGILNDRALAHLPPETALRVADCLSWLPDAVCPALEQAARQQQLSLALPFLDHNVVDFAWSLPPGLLGSPEEPMRPIYDVLARYVPPELTQLDRAETPLPIAHWLRGALRQWAWDLLSPDRLRQQGIVQVSQIQRLWQSLLSGQNQHQWDVWHIIVFQAWMEQYSA